MSMSATTRESDGPLIVSEKPEAAGARHAGAKVALGRGVESKER